MRFIIMGAGDVGSTLAAQLVEEQHDVVLIDRDEPRLVSASSQLDLQTIHGNGCSPEVLARAGLNTSDYFIAVAAEDEVNISACLSAKLLNPSAKRIARVRQVSLEHKDIAAEHIEEYFDLIVNPTQAAVEYLIKMFQVVGARDVLDFCEGKLKVVALNLGDDSPFIGKRLVELSHLREKLNMLVIAIIRDDELIIPRGKDEIKLDDTIYCVTPPDKVSVLFELAGLSYSEAKTAMVWGGSGIGQALSHRLVDFCSNVKLIISESELTPELVDECPNILLLTGDGKDKDLLIEENVQDVDAFISVTDDEEDNILASLLAKKLGARSSMALVNKATYLPLVHAIGVDVVVSSRLEAASAIFRHIQSETIISEFSLRHLGAGFVEVTIEEKMPIHGKSISEIKIPEGTIFAAINRGDEIIIATGMNILQSGDVLVLMVRKGTQKKLEKLFAKKLEFFV